MTSGLITVTPLVDSNWYSLFQVNSDFFNMGDFYAPWCSYRLPLQTFFQQLRIQTLPDRCCYCALRETPLPHMHNHFFLLPPPDPAPMVSL